MTVSTTMTRIGLVFFGILALWGGLVSLGSGATTPPIDEDERLVGLRERWADAVRDLRLPGMSVVVVQHDEVILQENFGIRDPDSREPVTEDTAFYIASCTKTYVAFAIVMLAEEGLVDLDAPLKRYLPRFKVKDEKLTETITVRDILCHAPGINYFPIVFLDAYTGDITEDRFYHFLADSTPRGELQYTNVHFTLAGRIIEAVSGLPWRDFLQKRLFEPSGMLHTTGYADEMYARENVAFPSLHNGFAFERAPVRKNDRTMHAAGGLGTSAHDAAQYLRLMLGYGSVDDSYLLSEEGVQEMLRKHSFREPSRDRDRERDDAPDISDGFGLGWNFGTYHDEPFYQHGGGYVGSASLITFFPEADFGVGVLINSDQNGHRMTSLVTRDVADRLLRVEGRDTLEDLVKRVQGSRPQSGRPTYDNPAPEHLSLAPEAYAGVYENEWWGTLRIHVQGGRLIPRIGDLGADFEKAETDRFLFHTHSGLDSEGSFRIEEGRVVGLTVDLGLGPVTFARSE